ncbi:hypothetical protein [Streptomyces sp. NPDC058674]|uniref:hypothetical protein n=1 Tax=Streptomyces sp. NPDC058674 TaxID=3346592 RepID=UPI00365499DF
MSLSTLYNFLIYDVLGNTLSTLLITGAGYTVKKICSRSRTQDEDNDQTPC